MIQRLTTLLATIMITLPQGISQSYTSSVDSIVQTTVAREGFEGVILIASDGKISYNNAFGYKDLHKSIPIRTESRFSIASVTKLFTAIVIMQLAEEGIISLSDRLSDLLPEYKISKSDKITVHHLLLHISGLPNEKDDIYTRQTSPENYVRETLVNKRSKLGTFNYANIDYILLGLIIEKYDRRSWQKAIKVRILEPTGMTDTGYLSKDMYPDDYCFSYSFTSDGKRQADPTFYIENFYAAGCMYSTAEDLLKLDQALHSNLLLTDLSKQLMYTSYPEYNYSGYNVWTYNFPFAPTRPLIMERRGGILGANVVLIRFLEANKTLIILSNNNRFNPDSFGDVGSLKEALIIEIDKTNK